MIFGIVGINLKPSYKEVYYQNINHVESVEIVHDSAKIIYKELLRVFCDNYYPANLNCWGHDVESQHRLAIFFHDEEQKNAFRTKEYLNSSSKYFNPMVRNISR